MFHKIFSDTQYFLNMRNFASIWGLYIVHTVQQYVTDLDGVFALGQSVPQFNRFIATAGDDLSVVRRKRNAQNIFRVANELTCGFPTEKSKMNLLLSKSRNINCNYALRSHKRSVLSQLPDSANCPSELITTSVTKWPWPCSDRCGIP